MRKNLISKYNILKFQKDISKFSLKEKNNAYWSISIKDNDIGLRSKSFHLGHNQLLSFSNRIEKYKENLIDPFLFIERKGSSAPTIDKDIFNTNILDGLDGFLLSYDIISCILKKETEKEVLINIDNPKNKDQDIIYDTLTQQMNKEKQNIVGFDQNASGKEFFFCSKLLEAFNEVYPQKLIFDHKMFTSSFSSKEKRKKVPLKGNTKVIIKKSYIDIFSLFPGTYSSDLIETIYDPKKENYYILMYQSSIDAIADTLPRFFHRIGNINIKLFLTPWNKMSLKDIKKSGFKLFSKKNNKVIDKGKGNIEKNIKKTFKIADNVKIKIEYINSPFV